MTGVRTPTSSIATNVYNDVDVVAHKLLSYANHWSYGVRVISVLQEG